MKCAVRPSPSSAASPAPEKRIAIASARPGPDALMFDLKLGGRMLVKYPGLTIVGGFAMAVAIGVGATVYEAISDILDLVIRLPGEPQRHARVRPCESRRRRAEGDSRVRSAVYRPDYGRARQRLSERAAQSGRGRDRTRARGGRGDHAVRVCDHQLTGTARPLPCCRPTRATRRHPHSSSATTRGSAASVAINFGWLGRCTWAA